MKKHLLTCVLLALCCTAASFAQEKTVVTQYELRGVLKDKDSAVFAGTPVFFNNQGQENSVLTDINGKFKIGLAPGDYEVTVRKTLSENFKAFISIRKNGLNPNDVEFVVEPNAVCCGASSEKPYPKIVSLPKPPYPAAARAVRATGEVVVEVKIDREGKVIEAKSVSGHPLLRVASAQAARSSLFETSESDQPREVKLVYVFLLGDEAAGVKRYSNLYRVEVIGTTEIIQASL